MISKTLYLYTETPLHAGTGSGLSSVDLPIQRERTTQYPMIQSSGIKGKLRSALEGERDDQAHLTPEMADIVFGPPPKSDGASSHAGALIVGDARLLLFPVRSLNGIFAYTTSYDILNRFKRDIEREPKGGKLLNWDMPNALKEQAFVTTSSEIHHENALVLEDLSFTAQEDSRVDTIADWLAQHALPNLGADYWPRKLKSSLVILPNDVFRDFVLYATEIITRIRIDRAKKTVENGALWTEEHLPTDTLLYVPLYATKAHKKASLVTEQQVFQQIEQLNNTYLQLGGDETVGRGLVRVRLS